MSRVGDALAATMSKNADLVTALRKRVAELEDALGPFVAHDHDDIEHELDGGLPNTVRIRVTDDEYRAACAAMNVGQE